MLLKVYYKRKIVNIFQSSSELIILKLKKIVKEYLFYILIKNLFYFNFKEF